MALLYSLADTRSPFLTSLALVFTALAEELTVIVVVCALYWCVNKRTAIIIAISYFLSGLLVQGLKITFRIDRPWVLDPSFEAVPEALETATGYSFPSGHTQSGTAFYGTLGFLSRKKGALAVCFAAFFLVGLSRMYLGVHTPLDVFTSMALALFISGLVSLWSVKHPDEPIGFKAICAFAAIAAALVAYAAILQSGGVIPAEYALDCIKAGGAGLGFAAGLYIEQKYVNFSCATPKLWMQPLKLLVGVGVIAAIRFGFKAAFGASPVANLISHFLITLWIIGLFPMLIKRFFPAK